MFDFDLGTLTLFQMDGEPVQIDRLSIFNDPEKIRTLHDQNIVIGKPSASTSEITEPCDEENCFIGPKAALKYIHDSDVAFKEQIVERLAVVCDARQVNHGNLPAHHKKLFNKNTAFSSSNGSTKLLAFSYDH